MLSLASKPPARQGRDESAYPKLDQTTLYIFSRDTDLGIVAKQQWTVDNGNECTELNRGQVGVAESCRN